MKNISDMKKYRTRSNAVILRVLALLVLFCVGTSAMADSTYYLLLFQGNTSNPADLANQGSVTASGTFTWNLTVVSGTNYYLGVSTSNTYTGLTVTKDDQASKITNTTGTLLSAKGQQDAYVGSTQYFFYRVAFTTSGNVTLTYTSANGEYTFASASACSMQIKHSWNGGSQTWQTMTSAGGNVYTYVGQYGGSSVCQISNDAGASNTQYSATLTGSPTTGDYCTFTFTSTGSCATSGGAMTITKNSVVSYYVAGNGSVSGINNWCNGKDWDAAGSAMTGSPASITFSNVYKTVGDKLAFKVTTGAWAGSGGTEYSYDNWDEDESDLNGASITTDDYKNFLIDITNGEANAQNITITINTNNTSDEIHIKCTDVATLPEIYIGEKPQKDGNTLTGNVYLAQTGGATVTDIKVYYAKDAEPNVASSPYVTLTGPFACGNLYPFSIEDICSIGSGDYQIKAQATNSAGSQASDVVAFNNFVCCPGSIEAFTLQSEAESVEAGESYGFFTTIEGGGATPTYLWEVKIGSGEWQTQVSTLKDMYYLVPIGTAGGTEITVRVTVTGSNCGDTKTLTTKTTVCYTPEITSFTVPTSTGAWETTEFTAGINNASSFAWSADPAATITDATATGANFKAAPGEYNITFTVGENSCNTTVSETKRIEVRPDHDTCGQQ